MKGIVFTFALIGILIMGTNRHSDLADLRLVTVQYQSLQEALTSGYNLAPGPNQCLSNSSFGALGYRFINNSLLDGKVDYLQPEALVYVPAPNGTLRLGAVEYIVPTTAWNANAGWPQINGHQFHLNPSLGAYVLHMWVWETNPSGMFEDWNPKVSCA